MTEISTKSTNPPQKTDQQRTIEAKETFLEVYFNNACNISTTCKAANIDRGTYYHWIDTDPEFHKKVENVEEQLIDTVESKLLKHIHADNLKAIVFYLKTKGRSRGYIEKIETENKHSFFDPSMISQVRNKLKELDDSNTGNNQSK